MVVRAPPVAGSLANLPPPASDSPGHSKKTLYQLEQTQHRVQIQCEVGFEWKSVYGMCSDHLH